MWRFFRKAQLWREDQKRNTQGDQIPHVKSGPLPLTDASHRCRLISVLCTCTTLAMLSPGAAAVTFRRSWGGSCSGDHGCGREDVVPCLFERKVNLALPLSPRFSAARDLDSAPPDARATILPSESGGEPRLHNNINTGGDARRQTAKRRHGQKRKPLRAITRNARRC